MRFELTRTVLLAAVLLAGCTFASRLSPVDYFSTDAMVRLARAVSSGRVADIDSAIAAGADVNGVGREGMTPVFWAIIQDEPESLDHLLDRGASPNVMTRWTAANGQPRVAVAMVMASAMGPSSFLRPLLAHGGDPNAGDGKGNLVLGEAAAHGSAANVGLLLDAGADINARNADGRTAFLLAVIQGAYENALLLLERGADPTIRQNGGGNAVDFLKSSPGIGHLPASDQKAHAKVLAELRRREFMD